MPGGPAKVKAPKSVLFTECTPEVKIKNTCLMQLTHCNALHKLQEHRKDDASLGTINPAWTSE